jgi:hypothetical protein
MTRFGAVADIGLFKGAASSLPSVLSLRALTSVFGNDYHNSFSFGDVLASKWMDGRTAAVL